MEKTPNSIIKLKEQNKNNPIISIIITAYNRKQFLKYAVQSVLNQNFPKHNYEIIIVKNFITEFDKEWISKGIKIIYKKEGSVGQFLALGIIHSKGEIISFLDDDDTFERRKLKVVSEMFSKYKDLVYYHNDFKVNYEDKYNKPLKMPNINIKRFIPTSSKRYIYKFVLFGYYFNLSCVSIKRQISINNIDYIKKIITDPDDFFGYLAMSIKGKILCDNLKLTNYRIHKNNTSRSNPFGRNGHYDREYKMYHVLFKDFLLKTNQKIALKALYSRAIRNELDYRVLNSKDIKISKLMDYVKNFSIPYLIYCGKLDLFIILIILNRISKSKAQAILVEREGLTV
ncbi:glycosyltransferase [Candidatus Mancarchaeum acidiphilum]|uniref:Glycosyltransferase n=1 Tax=Candidatus Mancarchaeum acidiphilum TaxID=1920749 RepID=A0A218NN21_9ARCH|nr:glycosyltransferase family 2 protein [Candidatus Mancarchaeum acidiphilum]ASI13866.1 glycosyltransferase [Candidatus Mancarchaeum acidiphilum]